MLRAKLRNALACVACACVLIANTSYVMATNTEIPDTSYTLMAHHIESTIVFIPSKYFGDTSIAHFNEALYQWNSNAGKTLMRRDPVLRHTDSYPVSDDESYIYRNADKNSSNVALSTVTRTADKTVLISCDVELNMKYNWANSAQEGCYDVWSVFLHEAGHAAGLGDVNYSSSIMHYCVFKNSERRYLRTGDITGLQIKY